MRTKTKESILEAYTDVYNTLRSAGLKTQLQIMDNECSELLKEFMRTEDIAHQQVPPGNHRANAAERAIRTAKNHFIAGISTTPGNFPVRQWDKMLPQAEITLNLMRGSRLNPKLSAWAQAHGHYDFNQTPMAPPGINVVVHEDANDRASWAPHAIQGNYMGLALNSYWCYTVFISKTSGTSITGTLVWFPEKISMPGASSNDIIPN